MKFEPQALMQTSGHFKIWLSNYWSKFALTLCWKNDGSRYLSNLSSYFTSDFFHFTCERKTGFKFWFNDEVKKARVYPKWDSIRRSKEASSTHWIRHWNLCVWHQFDFAFAGQVYINNSVAIETDLQFLVRPQVMIFSVFIGLANNTFRRK